MWVPGGHWNHAELYTEPRYTTKMIEFLNKRGHKKPRKILNEDNEEVEAKSTKTAKISIDNKKLYTDEQDREEKIDDEGDDESFEEIKDEL